MAEHSIEELERQLKSAEGKAKEAVARTQEARKRLFKAKFEATGFAGCIAEYESTNWKTRGKTVRFLPNRMSRWGGYIEGPVIKQDGSIGIKEVSCDPSNARNLGPYEAAS